MKKLLLLLLCSPPFMVLSQQVSNLKITILSTMMADLKGVGEWGFAALIETDNNRILFDAGLKPNSVVNNAAELNVSLAGIPSLVLSHNHTDHTGGLFTLRNTFKDSGSFTQIYTGPGFFNREAVPVGLKKQTDSLRLSQSGISFQTIESFRSVAPGIYLTGPTPRRYDEKNYPPGKKLKTATGEIEDNVPEDMSMVLDTPQGLVIISGCGHAGIVNTVTQVTDHFPGKKVLAVIGGFHLLDTPEPKVSWTAQELKKTGVQYFIGAHCTGLNALYQLRAAMGLPKEQCVVGTVGMTFTPDTGIKGGWMK